MDSPLGQENCEACGTLGGRAFAISEAELGVNLPPLHPNCDCCVGVLDNDGKIAALIGSSEDGFDLLSLPDNMARTPSGRLACRFETADFSSVGGVPLVLWEGEKTALGTQADMPQDSYLVTAQQLIEIGFSPVAVTPQMVRELNTMLIRYGITNMNSIQHFLAQCCIETSWGGKGTYGNALIEKYDGDPEVYFRTKSKVSGGPKFRGTGYIHLTHDYNYQAFSDYLAEQGRYDPLIMEKGYERIAEAYAWEAAAWFWSIHTQANEIASAPGTSPDELTRIVNKYTDTYSERKRIYYEDVLPAMYM